MALIGNYHYLLSSPGRYLCNVSTVNTASAMLNPGSYRARFYGETMVRGVTDKCSVPANYGIPYVAILAPKAGGIGSNLGIKGLGTISNAKGAMGRYRTSAFSGSGSITNAQMGLVVSAVATLAGNSTIFAVMNADLTLIANITGTGNATAAVRALGNAIATITGTGTLTNIIRATGELEADITPFTPLSPESLARAVWSDVVNNYPIAGTFGKTVKQIKNNGAAGL